jgi:hypothetical protein
MSVKVEASLVPGMNMTPQPEANSHGNPKTKLKKLETPSPLDAA